MAPTKVVHLTSVHSPFDVRIFHKECKSLAAAGYDVTLIVPCEQEEIKDGIRLRAVPKPGGRRERMTRTVWQVYRAAMAEDARVYHIHDPELLPIGMLLRFRGKQVIYDVHEDVPKQILTKSWVPSKLRRETSRSVAMLENAAGKTFSGIVAATPSIAAHFPASKTIVVQNFPIVEVLVYGDRLPYSQRSPNVVYIGGISEKRGAREMVQAMAALPDHLDCRLLLAGKFTSSSLADDVLPSSGGDRVEFLGWLDRAEMQRMLRKTRVGLVLFHPAPNHLESQPNKLFEYMSAGIPIVASDFPVWRKLVEEIDCGLLVDPLDPTAIAEAIQWLLEHPQEAEAMGERGQEAVRARYNWDHEKQKLLSCYRELVE